MKENMYDRIQHLAMYFDCYLVKATQNSNQFIIQQQTYARDNREV